MVWIFVFGPNSDNPIFGTALFNMNQLEIIERFFYKYLHCTELFSYLLNNLISVVGYMCVVCLCLHWLDGPPLRHILCDFGSQKLFLAAMNDWRVLIGSVLCIGSLDRILLWIMPCQINTATNHHNIWFYSNFAQFFNPINTILNEFFLSNCVWDMGRRTFDASVELWPVCGRRIYVKVLRPVYQTQYNPQKNYFLLLSQKLCKI